MRRHAILVRRHATPDAPAGRSKRAQRPTGFRGSAPKRRDLSATATMDTGSERVAAADL
jgi:hypothetical protein